jgi:hypothetical protein
VRHPLRFTLFVTAFALWACLATTVFAAPAAWETMDVTRHSDTNGGVLLVSGELPASTKLPAEAELSVPAGLELQWIGEILGGASADDPELKYTKSTAGGSDIYRFTLTKARTAQVEALVADKQGFDGATYTSSVAWAATQNVPEVRVNIRVPQAAQIASPSPDAAVLPGDASYGFYSKAFKNVKAGDMLDLAVAYSLPAVGAAASAAAAPAASNSVVPIVVVLLAIAAFAGLVVAVRKKMTVSSSDTEDFDADEEDDPSGSQAQASRVATADADDSSVAEDDDEPVTKQPMTGRTKRNLVTAAIIGVLVVAAVVVGVQNTRPKMTGDTISQVFSSAEPCATADIALTVPDKADPQKTAETVFAAIRPIAGLTTATYNRKTNRIDIGYCESSSSEAALRQALAPTGLVAEGGTTVAPAP